MEFNKRDVNIKLARIATPIAIQGVVTATLSMVDNLMVGRLGEVELAAVGVAGQIFMVHYLVLFGILSGCATFMAQFYGTRDMANIRKVVGFGFTALAGLGITFFLISNLCTDWVLSIYADDAAVKELAAVYLRINSFSFLLLAFSAPFEMAFKATQQVRIPLLISMVVFSSNTIINYILIFGKLGFPALGVAGAALGTLAARILQVGMNAVFAFRSKNEFRGSVRSYFGWNRELIRRIIKNATPTTINEFLWSLGQTMFVAAFTRIGTTAYAAYQAANAIFNIFNFAAFSLGDAALILIGEKLGEGKVTIIVGVVIGLGTVLVASPLAGLFKLSEEGIRYTYLVLLMLGLTLPLDIYCGSMVAGVLRGGGDTRFSMIVECSTVWFIAVPLAFISALVWHLPVHLAFLMTRLEAVIKAGIFVKRYISKKWMNTVIEDL